MSHRRKLAERIAPWALMLVLALLWWSGARIVQWSGLARIVPPVAATADRVSDAGSGMRGRVATSVPPPRPVTDPLPAVAAPSDAPGGGTSSAVSSRGTPVVTFQDITDLRRRALTVPVQGVASGTLASSYRDPRDEVRRHEAMDIPSPRGTPVIAVEDGRIAKLFDSARGGLTIYQFDPAEQFAYYYAHLDGYAAGLREGDVVHRGAVIGYVGTTGNAPANAPHLHFAIVKLGQEKRWWEGTPLDPYVVWR